MWVIPTRRINGFAVNMAATQDPTPKIVIGNRAPMMNRGFFIGLKQVQYGVSVSFANPKATSFQPFLETNEYQIP